MSRQIPPGKLMPIFLMAMAIPMAIAALALLARVLISMSDCWSCGW